MNGTYAESGESMSLIVQKFGGSSVRDIQRLFHVAQRIRRDQQQGHQIVVVVSAQGKTTDGLIEKALEICESPSKREMDMLLSTGELMSISLLAMALQQLGCPAVSLAGWQVGIHTDGSHQNARILRVDTRKIHQLLDEGKVVIVAGFQGVTENGEITTLGRGGSDTTAVALAAALKADRCQIFTDVEGVYTADPRIVEEAVKLQEISYQDMLEMAAMGAKVLHYRSVELAKQEQVCLEVLSSLNEAPGTLVRSLRDSSPSLRGLTADQTTLYYVIPHITLEDAGRLMTDLYRQEIRPDLAEQPAAGQLCFAISSHQRSAVTEGLKRLRLGAFLDENYAKVTIVGNGLTAIPQLKQECDSALQEAEIPCRSSWLGERRLSFLLPRNQAQKAMQILHPIVLRHRT